VNADGADKTTAETIRSGLPWLRPQDRILVDPDTQLAAMRGVLAVYELLRTVHRAAPDVRRWRSERERAMNDRRSFFKALGLGSAVLVAPGSAAALAVLTKEAPKPLPKLGRGNTMIIGWDEWNEVVDRVEELSRR
jgi:hypothetical protein